MPQVHGGARAAGKARLPGASPCPGLRQPAGAAGAHTQRCTRAAAASPPAAPPQVSSFGVGGHVKLPGPSATEPNVYTFGTPYAVILDDLQRKDADLYTRNRLLQARPQPAAQHLAPLAWLEQHTPGLAPGLLPAHTRAEVSRSCPCYPLPGAARALHRVPRLAALLDGRRARAQMLHRNAGVKAAPQRWQDCSEPFDVAVTFEERILEQLLDGLPPACSPRPKLKSSTRVCPARRVALHDCQLTRAADMQKRGHSTMRPLLVINIVRARPPFRCCGVRAGCCGKRADGAPQCHAGRER